MVSKWVQLQKLYNLKMIWRMARQLQCTSFEGKADDDIKWLCNVSNGLFKAIERGDRKLLQQGEDIFKQSQRVPEIGHSSTYRQ